MEQQRYPLNVAGDFYVADGMCMACTAPEHEAPGLMAHDTVNAGYHCYFRRQPATPEEVESAVRALVVSCCGAVRYGGTSPVVLQRLAELGATIACDQPA